MDESGETSAQGDSGQSDPTREAQELGEQSGIEMQREDRLAEHPESEEGVRRREAFNNIEIRQSLHFSHPHSPDFAKFYEEVMEKFQSAVRRVLRFANSRDVVQVELRGESLSNSVFMIQHGTHNFEEFQQLLEKLVQSNRKILTDQSLEMVAQIVKNPTGGMGQKRKLKTLMDSEILKKKSRYLHIVENTDNQMCFSISLAYLLEPGLNESQAAVRGAEIHQSVGLSPDSPVTFEDISKFEQALKCKIVVFYREEGKKTLSKYMTTQPGKDQTFLLFLMGGHYHAIKSLKDLKGFLGTNFACESCFTGYDRRNSHSCPNSCSVCCDPGCPQHPLKLTYCGACNRTCRSPYCFQKHAEQRGKSASRCDTVKKCKKCNFPIHTPNHNCPKTKCRICGVPIPEADLQDTSISGVHQCYIEPEPRKKQHCEKFIFYDFETFINEKGEHVPFYVSTCTFEGKWWCAEGTQCAKRFLKYFRANRFKNYTFIAHNSKGFDSYLILSPLVEGNKTPSLIAQGSKILCFEDPDFNQKYIDSASFMQMPLSKLPKVFGFENSIKGYFPHHFSSEKNLKYIGPYPPPEAYGCDQMSVEDRERFLKWYQTVRGGEFNFKKEAEQYCKNDTDILRTACQKFRSQFIEDTDVDPLSCITIASACMKVFRTHYLPKKTVAIPCPGNYRSQSKPFSAAAIEWLQWEANSKGVFIQHALNSGEKEIGPYTVDGYAEVGSLSHVWEFLGCFYHGCITCHPPDETNPLTKTSYFEMYEKTQKKLQQLQSEFKLAVTSIWEHEWKKRKENDRDVAAFVKNLEVPVPLIPRDALYGGRTSAIRLRHTACDDETVSYVDVTSLYPHVMCDTKCFYPLDHPTIVQKDFDNLESYFGLIRAKVYPPRELFFPLLPYRTTKGKLLFTLCRLCGELNNQKESCSHSEEERALTGVWVTPEFKKAIELGYQIGKIYEIWHFPRKSNTLFKEYMFKFLKGKQEASGYPPGVKNETDKQKYISEYHKLQGIELDPSRISDNPAKRQIAKLCLNSLWGKFAQRSNMLTSTLVKNLEEFMQYMFSDKYDVRYFTFVSDKVALVQWKYWDKSKARPGKSDNVFIAAFVTAYGRLALYEYLSRLQERVLYHDTDSLVYVSKPGEYKLPTGEQLGELKDELSGDTIVEWVSSGPKSYAYKTSSDKVVLKAKGITQNYENREEVCFDSLKDLVEGYIDSQNPDEPATEIITSRRSIVRKKTGFILQNATQQKRYRVVYDKRRLLPDGKTLPFGF